MPPYTDQVVPTLPQETFPVDALGGGLIPPSQSPLLEFHKYNMGQALPDFAAYNDLLLSKLNSDTQEGAVGVGLSTNSGPNGVPLDLENKGGSYNYVPPPGAPEYYPGWSETIDSLILNYKQHHQSFLYTHNNSMYVWSDFLYSLLPTHQFLLYATCSLSSLHVDYMRCRNEGLPFEASDLSMYLFNTALATTSQESRSITTKNFEGLFLASSMIFSSSFRMKHSVIPLFATRDGHIDLVSLSKGPLIILKCMKDYLPDSPLADIFSKGSHDLEKLVSTKLCDNLLQVCTMLDEPPFYAFSRDDPNFNDMVGDDGPEHNLKIILDVLRNGPASPPQEVRSSSSQLGSFMTKENLAYLRLNPWDPMYLPEGVSEGEIVIPEDEEDGLASPGHSDSEDSQSSFSMNDNTPSSSSSKFKSNAMNRKITYTESLTILRVCCRKVLTVRSFSRLFVWMMLLGDKFLFALRDPYERTNFPFSRVILAHFLALMMFAPQHFWHLDRLMFELKLIMGDQPDLAMSEYLGDYYDSGLPSEWQPFLRFPRMVLNTIQERHKLGNYEPLGLDMFKNAVDYML